MTSFGGRTYSWLGRQLQSISGLATYTYNMDGLRTSKTANGVTTNYYYNGSTLAGQISSDGTKLIFLYDENGDIFGLTYQDANYYYIKNAQNDVIAIADAWGNILCRYEYDAWGKVLSITGDVAWFGQVNPIRYRSYYYDNESGLYYLKSRYYNPEIGRFICADGLVSTAQGMLSHNMFAYCNNNPVNMEDSNGDLPRSVKKLASAILSVGIKILSKSKNSKLNYIADVLKTTKKALDTNTKLNDIGDVMRSSDAIITQYVNDIEDVGQKGTVKTETPSSFVFPDVEAYNALCQEKYDMLTESPTYYIKEGFSFNKTEAINTVFSWDRSNTMDLCAYSFIRVFIKSISIALDLYM